LEDLKKRTKNIAKQVDDQRDHTEKLEILIGDVQGDLNKSNKQLEKIISKVCLIR